MNYNDILEGYYKLNFKHPITKPAREPDFSLNSLQLWVVDDGIICISPMRSLRFGNSRFVFPYNISGKIAYLCTFDEVKPLPVRAVRNSGRVWILTNKNAVPFKRAVEIVWNELHKAEKNHSRINATTNISSEYLTNRILSTYGAIKPVQVYNGTVCVLYVDFKSSKAVYKPLIPQSDIMRLYNFVSDQSDTAWSNSFPFSRERWLKLVETVDKTPTD